MHASFCCFFVFLFSCDRNTRSLDLFSVLLLLKQIAQNMHTSMENTISFCISKTTKGRAGRFEGGNGGVDYGQMRLVQGDVGN